MTRNIGNSKLLYQAETISLHEASQQYRIETLMHQTKLTKQFHTMKVKDKTGSYFNLSLTTCLLKLKMQKMQCH